MLRIPASRFTDRYQSIVHRNPIPLSIAMIIVDTTAIHWSTWYIFTSLKRQHTPQHNHLGYQKNRKAYFSHANWSKWWSRVHVGSGHEYPGSKERGKIIQTFGMPFRKEESYFSTTSDARLLMPDLTREFTRELVIGEAHPAAENLHCGNHQASHRDGCPLRRLTKTECL
jgi:hypothetical protein